MPESSKLLYLCNKAFLRIHVLLNFYGIWYLLYLYTVKPLRLSSSTADNNISTIFLKFFQNMNPALLRNIAHRWFLCRRIVQSYKCLLVSDTIKNFNGVARRIIELIMWADLKWKSDTVNILINNWGSALAAIIHFNLPCLVWNYYYN